MAQLTLQSDNVFGDDAAASQLGFVDGDVTSGYTVELTVPVDPTATSTGGAGAAQGRLPVAEGGARPAPAQRTVTGRAGPGGRASDGFVRRRREQRAHVEQDVSDLAGRHELAGHHAPSAWSITVSASAITASWVASRTSLELVGHPRTR